MNLRLVGVPLALFISVCSFTRHYFFFFLIFILLLFIMCVHSHFWSVKRYVAERRRTCLRISFWSILCLCASFAFFYLVLLSFHSSGVILQEVFKKEWRKGPLIVSITLGERFNYTKSWRILICIMILSDNFIFYMWVWLCFFMKFLHWLLPR